MKTTAFSIWIVGACVLFGSCAVQKGMGCLTGAFLADRPSEASIKKFEADYDKRPAIVLVFLDWGKYPDEAVIRDIYGSGGILMVTWEPWNADTKQGIDYSAVLRGKDDPYILEFASRLKAIGNPVLLRFAHEMNGDWYPWSSQKIGFEQYRHLFQYVHEVFERAGVQNVRWVFSINVENVPVTNSYEMSYPGEGYVDYVGLDGYNWGESKPWSRWQSFKDLFAGVYEQVIQQYKKPVMIAEFGTTSQGGNKAHWIKEALREVRRMPEVKALVLFNVDKETDWRFVPGTEAGQTLRNGLGDRYFHDTANEGVI